MPRPIATTRITVTGTDRQVTIPYSVFDAHLTPKADPTMCRCGLVFSDVAARDSHQRQTFSDAAL